LSRLKIIAQGYIMAANIHLHQPRVEHQLTEHDDNNNGEPNTPDGQIPPQSETIAAPSEQNGQSSGDGAGSDGGTHDPPSTPPPPPEESIPLPAQFRYGLGDTVIMGRPDYMRAYMERVQPSTGEPSVRETAFAPALRAENIPAPTNGIAAPAAKPIPMPKPGGTISPTSASPPAPAATVSPATTNAPRIGGEAMVPPTPDTGVTADLPSNREPYLYPGLHTAPEQSPHYANALAYGREHGYSDDEVMKLAVLMQANRDDDQGLAWLDLKPTVLRAAVNAVVRNADNSFDTSGVFGGQRGYHNAGFASQTLPADAHAAAYMSFTELSVAEGPYIAPDGWVLEERETSSGDAGSDIIRYYRPSDELIARNDIPYMPMLMSGYVQVPRGLDSELSVGADGGVHDLSRLDFHPDYGLVTTADNIRPLDNEDGLEQAVLIGIFTAATYGIFTAAAGGTIALNSGAGLLTGGTLSAAEALALSSFIATTGVTGDVRQGFIAGLASFVGSQVARFVVGPQGLQLNVNPNTPWTVGNFVSSIVSGTVSGAVQGDWRRGLINGLVSFSSNVIAHELKIPATVASAAIRSLYDPQGALNGLVTDLVTNPASVLGNTGGQSSEIAAQREAAVQELMAQGMNSEHANLAVDRIMAEATRLNTVTAQARIETQQRITWIRDAIDSGHPETAAGFFNDMVAQAAAENPDKPRAEIANQLMQALGIVPDTIGFVVGVDGRVTVDLSIIVTPTTLVPSPTLEARNMQRQDDYVRALQAMNANLSDDDARALALRWMDSPYSPLDPDLPDHVRQAMMRGLDPNMVIDLDTGSNFHPRALRPAAAELYRDLLSAAETQYGNDPVRLEQAYRDIDRVVREYNGMIRSAEYVLSGGAARDQQLNAILNDLVVRGGGLLQMIGGAGLVIAGAGANFTGIGALFGTLGILLGGDQMYAGARTVVNGAPARTMLGTALSNTMDLDPSQAELIAGLASMSPALAESALANPAIRTFLVERFGGMFGTNKPEIILGMERTFQRMVTLDANLSTGQLNNQVGRIAEDVVRQDLKNMGYRDVVAIQNTSGQGIDIIAKAPNGDLVVFAFEVKGSSVGSFRPLEGPQADFRSFVESRLQRAAGVSNDARGVYSEEVRQAADLLLRQLNTGVPFNGLRVNVTLPTPGTSGKPQIVYLTWK
jgi:Holliday junction resolvase-like predicted endonuclease